MIVLTARADELDRLRVFDRGGDDVVTEPFSYPELVRGLIRAPLRRAQHPSPALVGRVGSLTVNHDAREVRLGDRQVEFTPKEFELLRDD